MTDQAPSAEAGAESDAPDGMPRGRWPYDRAFTLWVGAAVLLGLVLRVLWVRWASHPPVWPYDPARYLGYAHEIAKGRGYVEPITGQPTAYYPPGYPWFLGIVDWFAVHTPLTDDLPLLASMVQAVLGAVTAAFGAVVAHRLAGRRAGILAAFGLALYPNLIFHTGALLGETLYDFLFLAFLAAVLWRPWPEGLTGRRVFAASVPLALAIMVRPISLALVPLLPLVWWASDRDWRSALRRTALVVAAIAVFAIPWTIRNEVRMHAFVALSTNGGENLCIGHAPGATGAFTTNEKCDVGDGVQYGSASEVRADKAKNRIATRSIRENLGREPWLLYRRAYFTFVRDGDHDGVVAVQSYRVDRWMAVPTEARLFRIADIAYWLVSAAGVVGLVRLGLSRRPEAWLLVAATLVTAIVPLAFFGDARFKVPVMPLLLIAAACAPFASRRQSQPEPEPQPQ